MEDYSKSKEGINKKNNQDVLDNFDEARHASKGPLYAAQSFTSWKVTEKIHWFKK